MSMWSAIGSSIGDAVLGNWQGKKAQKRAHRYNKEFFDYKLQQLQGMGLTPQEIVGSVGATGGSNTPSMGNQSGMSQANLMRQQLGTQKQIADARNRTDLQIEASRASTSRYVADQESGDRGRSMDLTQELNAGQLAKIRAEVEVLRNTKQTGSPEFVLRLRRMAQGVENTALEVYFENVKQKYGIDFLSEKGRKKFRSLPEHKRLEIVNELEGIGHSVARATGAARRAHDEMVSSADDRDRRSELGNGNKYSGRHGRNKRRK